MEICLILSYLYELRNFPKLIQGMPGIGKTTSIMALAHALLGDAFKEGVLELNASDERYNFIRIV